MNDLVIQTVNKIFNCDIQVNNRKKNNAIGRRAFVFYMRRYSYLKLREIAPMVGLTGFGVAQCESRHYHFYENDLEYKSMFDELMKIHPLNICHETTFKIFRFNSDPYKKYLRTRNAKLRKP